MNLEIDSFNQRCDGLQIKARGMGKGWNYQNFVKLSESMKQQKKNLMIIKDNF